MIQSFGLIVSSNLQSTVCTRLTETPGGNISDNELNEFIHTRVKKGITSSWSDHCLGEIEIFRFQSNTSKSARGH